MTTASKEAQTPKEGPEPLGILPRDTVIGLQTEVFKELINKFAWALGSTYRVAYSNQRSEARQLAIRMAKRVVEVQGYPEYLRK